MKIDEKVSETAKSSKKLNLLISFGLIMHLLVLSLCQLFLAYTDKNIFPTVTKYNFFVFEFFLFFMTKFDFA